VVHPRFLREIFLGWTITAMLDQRRSSVPTGVNILKKVKVNGQWRLCPAIVDTGGKLKDRVRVNGHTEIHSEGVYYIEWRDQGRRRREAISSRHDVLEQARLKALELETARLKPEIIDPPQARSATAIVPQPVASSAYSPVPSLEDGTSRASVFLHGIESYLHALIGNALHSHLAALGMKALPDPSDIAAPAPPTGVVPSPHYPKLSPRPFAAPATQPGLPPGTNNRQEKTIAEAVDSYLATVKPPQREPKTYDEYQLVLEKFRDVCTKKYLREVERDDLLAFRGHLFSIGNEARTVFNRMGIVTQLLKRNRITGLLERGDKPKYVEGLREMYKAEDLEALFKVCTPDENVLYTFLLLTGERDKEVRYTTWDDIDVERKKVRVTVKKRLGFKPKDKEEREIPVPSTLIDALMEYKQRQRGPNPHNLVFPTSNGRPDKKFENKLKRIARRHNLNCGRCVSRFGNKCSEGPHCGKWYLHKFRHTYATTTLESGFHVRELQEWLGHSDLETTMNYLKFVLRKDAQQLLDRGEMAELASKFAHHKDVQQLLDRSVMSELAAQALERPESQSAIRSST
jgi:integrase